MKMYSARVCHGSEIVILAGFVYLYLLVYCISSDTGRFCSPSSCTVYRAILARSVYLYLLVYCISSDTGWFCLPLPARVLYIERYWLVLFTFTCSFTVYRAILARSVYLYLLVYCILLLYSMQLVCVPVSSVWFHFVVVYLYFTLCVVAACCMNMHEKSAS